MKRFQMQLVSLLLFLGLTAFSGDFGLHLQPLNASQHSTFHTNAPTGVLLADGGDPVPPPMPLPGAPKPVKPVSRNINSTGILLADGGDPVPPPMPLPGAPKPPVKPPSRTVVSMSQFA